MGINYSEYLKIQELLDLQQPHSDPEQHDETLFIIIHQVYELWFKLMLHEFGRICVCMRGRDLFGAIAGFQRVRSVMKTLVGQLDVLETMTRDELIAYYRERYVPQNMITIVVGDVDPAAVEQAIRDTFAGWPRQPRDHGPLRAQEH